VWTFVWALLAPGAAAAADTRCDGNQTFLIGTGIYDLTGPVAEVGMMGYAMVYQRTLGIHQRLRARAFVVASPCNDRRVGIVVADVGLLTQAMQQQLVERLRGRYGTLYTERNLLLTATHTHSGPGGYSHYAMYNLTILGFSEQNLSTVVDGLYEALVRAHENLAPGRILAASGELLGATINRSPEAYAQNPAAERARYPYDVDPLMTVLRFQRRDGRDLGMLSWFAAHATSMGNENRLISGDNKGYASYQFERWQGTDYRAADTFVGAFAQTAEGDVSPNIYGGTDGGGTDDFESTRISGEKQYRKARELYAQANVPLTGPVDSRHTFVKMDDVTIAPLWTDGESHTTCPAAIGISMLAGAEDGRGFGYEGVTCGTMASWWHGFTCGATTTPCQAEKPIVLEMGTKKPYPWTPEVLPLQVVRLGNLALVALPHEVTTMAGRRLAATVERELPAGIDRVLIAGLSNAYAGYVTTREEYRVQHYEGASTHFGPWTLAALQQEFRTLAAALRTGEPVPPGPTPRDLRNAQATLLVGVLFDDVPMGLSFGSVHTDASAGYRRGETVRVTFWGAHPNNDLQLQDTYLEIQRQEGSAWTTVANDWDWETKYHWQRHLCLPALACSHVTVEWAIPDDAPPGTYRIRHDGHRRALDGTITPYAGVSRKFTVME
jgi:neutral ceramidase